MFSELLDVLYRGGAYAYYHWLPARRSIWYPLDRPPQIDPSIAKSNLYFAVHPACDIPPCNAHGEIVDPQYIRGQTQYIAAINCLYAEYDVKDYGSKAAIANHLAALPVVAPSVTVDSGGGLHAYWLLDAPYLIESDEQRHAAKTLQDRWVGVVGGDAGVKDLTRVLRVPGSVNYKYHPPQPVTWQTYDLDCRYPLRTLTAYMPPVVRPCPKLAPVYSGTTITDFNANTAIGDILQRHGYSWAGRYKMLSPYSSTGSAGVSIDYDRNKAYVHHGSDPLHTGYWASPFDVVKTLDCGGDFAAALKRIRHGH
jgi:hypothetical protein